MVCIALNELKAIIQAERKAAIEETYKQVKAEIEATRKEKEFAEKFIGLKELHSYLQYKGYYNYTLSSLQKTNYKELADGSIYRKGMIDHQFNNCGFSLKRRK